METLVKAKLSSRFFASLIDYIIVIAFYWFFAYFFGEPNGNGGYVIYGFTAIVPFVFWFIYLIVVESIFSRTFGHFIFDLKVVGEDNGNISFIEAVLRHIIDLMDFWFFGIPAMISIKNTPKNQRLGDMVARTIVVVDKEM
jgi:uncharacterized RDD family membrane protein YckC